MTTLLLIKSDHAVTLNFISIQVFPPTHLYLFQMPFYNHHFFAFKGFVSATTKVISKNKSVGKAGLVLIGPNRWNQLSSKLGTEEHFFPLFGTGTVEEKLWWFLTESKALSICIFIQIFQCSFCMLLNYRHLIKQTERDVQN